MKHRVAHVERHVHLLSSGSYEVRVFVTGAGARLRYFGRRTPLEEIRAWITATREEMLRATGRLDKTRAELRAMRATNVAMGVKKGAKPDPQSAEKLSKPVE